ncbi:hypothetical protein M434DRAFT_66240 [Hypoxylon sp. CO27-5]|nr:hypothetical protein M434DRAFT_66240 [Hypoxylon sp. CO27-5]
MISPTLGGGVGRFSGIHGIISDQLLSVRLVTANGSIVTASDHENIDLFWGMRGAGGNFGIVVEAVYQVTDLVSETVTNLDYAFAQNATGEIIDYLSSFGDNTPAKLSLIVKAFYDEVLFGGYTIIVSGAYQGPRSEAEALLEPLLRKVTPLKQNITVVPENKLVYSAMFGSEGNPDTACADKGVKRSIFGAGIKKYDKDTYVRYIEEFGDLITANASLRGSLFLLEHFSVAKVQEIPDETSAYPYRDIIAHLLFHYSWTDPVSEEPIDVFGKNWRAEFQSTGGFNPPQTYVNYGHGDENNEVLYSKRKLPRLRQLKNEWDPNHIFRFHHDITTV